MASDMGWETEEDIVEFCREYRKGVGVAEDSDGTDVARDSDGTEVF
jgi:hypothetical protein